jgi:inhibitor of KinA
MRPPVEWCLPGGSLYKSGGWQIIGRTPLNLFAPHRKNLFLYKAGDKIKFIPVSRKEFTKLENMEEN